jgi:type II secretory pathway pseudopilin PulG
MFNWFAGPIDWEAVSAIGTIAATLVALFASWLAIRAPEWSRRADRREATSEVLRATGEAIEIYRGAAQLVAEKSWPDDLVTLIRIRADHLYATLDRLIGRPSLTDGAIAVGAGAMSILAAIRNIPSSTETVREVSARGGDPRFARMVETVRPAKLVLESAADVVEVVERRVERVRAYANRRWYHWRRWRGT